MQTPSLPPCGLYRTTGTVAGVEAGRLVFFHNHGDPGPGVYLPERWNLNRAEWRSQGHTLTDPAEAIHLEAVPHEGFYRVTEAFTCCEKACRTYEPGLLVQLGYDGRARPLLFVPEWTETGFAIPEMGQPLDADRLERLAPLKVAEAKAPSATA